MAIESAAVARKVSLIQQSLSGLTYLRGFALAFFFRTSAIFKQTCLHLPPSHLSNIQANLASPSSFAPRQYSSKLDITLGLASVDFVFPCRD
ncbi:MAG: hypothetical protein SPE31_04910, partial [Prevotella sp.]|nr:hypothetical protein [Prevotella sp.]